MKQVVRQEDWRILLKRGVQAYLDQNVAGHIDTSHIEGTADRVVRAFAEYASGYDDEPAKYLQVGFNNVGEIANDPEGSKHILYDGMVFVRGIRINSTCAHHIVPIVGKAYFAYVPNVSVVGLSKIPRFIRALSRRLQVQENLTEEIVDVFQTHVNPKGCAVYIEAEHMCMSCRGVLEHGADTATIALRGCFKTPSTKAEFFSGMKRIA